MGGSNCTFFDCPTCGKYKLLLFRIPSVSAFDGEHTKELKRKAPRMASLDPQNTRNEGRTEERNFEANNNFVCERPFKPECIVTGKFLWSTSSLYICFMLILLYILSQFSMKDTLFMNIQLFACIWHVLQLNLICMSLGIWSIRLDVEIVT